MIAAAGRDEDRAEHQGDQYADQQDALLEVGRHGELRHDQDEDEEVVHTQGLLGDEAREELLGGLAVAEEQQAETEEHGEDDPDDRPDAGFLDGHVMGFAADEEVGSDEDSETQDGQHPEGR